MREGVFWIEMMRDSNGKILNFRKVHQLLRLIGAGLLLASFSAAQTPDQAAVIHGIDAAVKARIDHVAAYSVIEHYKVFRGGDETNPAAEMVVRTEYRKNQGKNFTILAESGSTMLRSQLLGSILKHEKEMSQPGVRETVLVNSSNYQFTLKSTAPQMLNGRSCLLLALRPLRNSPSLFTGTLWVDAKDYSIVQLMGKASKSASFLTGASDVSRQYAMISGYPMAIRAVAVTRSGLMGTTTIQIDSSNYQVQQTQ